MRRLGRQREPTEPTDGRRSLEFQKKLVSFLVFQRHDDDDNEDDVDDKIFMLLPTISRSKRPAQQIHSGKGAGIGSTSSSSFGVTATQTESESAMNSLDANRADKSLAMTPVDIIIDKLGADIVSFHGAFQNALDSKPPPPLIASSSSSSSSLPFSSRGGGGIGAAAPEPPSDKKISLAEVSRIFSTLHYDAYKSRLSRVKSVFTTFASSSPAMKYHSKTSVIPSHAKVCTFADLLRIHYALFAGRGLSADKEECGKRVISEGGDTEDTTTTNKGGEKDGAGNAAAPTTGMPAQMSAEEYKASDESSSRADFFDKKRKAMVDVLQRRFDELGSARSSHRDRGRGRGRGRGGGGGRGRSRGDIFADNTFSPSRRSAREEKVEQEEEEEEEEEGKETHGGEEQEQEEKGEGRGSHKETMPQHELNHEKIPHRADHQGSVKPLSTSRGGEDDKEKLLRVAQALKAASPSTLKKKSRATFASLSLYASSSVEKDPPPIPWTDASLCLAELGWGGGHNTYGGAELGDERWIWAWRASQVTEGSQRGSVDKHMHEREGESDLDSSSDLTSRVSKAFEDTVLTYSTFCKMLKDLRTETIAAAELLEKKIVAEGIATTLNGCVDRATTISSVVKPIFNTLLEEVEEVARIHEVNAAKEAEDIKATVNELVLAVEEKGQAEQYWLGDDDSISVSSGELESLSRTSGSLDVVADDHVEQVGVEGGEKGKAVVPHKIDDAVALKHATKEGTLSLLDDGFESLSVSSNDLSTLSRTSGSLDGAFAVEQSEQQADQYYLEEVDSISVSSGDLSSLPFSSGSEVMK